MIANQKEAKMGEQAEAKSVWAVHRSFEFADGARSSMVLRVFGEKAAAERWMNQVQRELQGQISSMQLGVPHQDPSGQVTLRPAMPCGRFLAGLGLSGVGHTTIEHKISTDSQILVPTKSGLILPH